MDSMVKGSNPDRVKNFVSTHKLSEQLWGPTSLVFNGYRGYFPKGTAGEGLVTKSPPCRKEAKNELSLPIILLCLPGVYREHFKYLY